MSEKTLPPVFRFAPSPNGALHLGHAYSALINEKLARKCGGRLLLRIEDIDATRCTPALEAAMIADLEWLGLSFERPFRRQSEHLDAYREALARLIDRGLVYPAFLSRGELREVIARHEATGAPWPRDPDGAPLYPDHDRRLSSDERRQRIGAGAPFAWRLDTAKALATLSGPLLWTERGAGPSGEEGRIEADPAAWGDVALARRDGPTSYHLSVTVDDASQGVTDVARGRDLYRATSVHRLLQALLGLPAPFYHHHDLVVGPDGAKLSKSRKDAGLAALRAAGETPISIRRRLGFEVD